MPAPTVVEASKLPLASHNPTSWLTFRPSLASSKTPSPVTVIAEFTWKEYPASKSRCSRALSLLVRRQRCGGQQARGCDHANAMSISCIFPFHRLKAYSICNQQPPEGMEALTSQHLSGRTSMEHAGRNMLHRRELSFLCFFPYCYQHCLSRMVMATNQKLGRPCGRPF